ncbi:UNVERIFIED_CONTAM: hypothetical protein Sradi_5258300 [Sesamum radiatum]|uniref:Helitron helicase-like domain-containing protein n=1 Tax=Sesamum radiatum TaxID=300843 RepID=A0AAW2LLS1_SESRA
MDRVMRARQYRAERRSARNHRTNHTGSVRSQTSASHDTFHVEMPRYGSFNQTYPYPNHLQNRTHIVSRTIVNEDGYLQSSTSMIPPQMPNMNTVDSGGTHYAYQNNPFGILPYGNLYQSMMTMTSPVMHPITSLGYQNQLVVPNMHTYHPQSHLATSSSTPNRTDLDNQMNVADNDSSTASDTLSDTLMVDENDEDHYHIHHRKYIKSWEFGAPNCVCTKCGAIMWYEECNRKDRRPAIPNFSICCRDGQVQLPFLKEPPEFLKKLLDYNGDLLSKRFRENIRIFNSMFAFTSMGGCINNRINDGRGPYCFVLNGQNHHLIGSLLPDVDRSPNFMQLYVVDTENEVRNRIRALNKDDRKQNFDPNIIQGLQNMFDEHNPLTKVLRMARDRFRESDYVPVRLRFIGTRKKDGRQYNLPTTFEVAALIVGDGQQSRGTRDIVIEERGRGLQRITELHPRSTLGS